MKWSVVESLPVVETLKYGGPDRDHQIAAGPFYKKYAVVLVWHFHSYLWKSITLIRMTKVNVKRLNYKRTLEVVKMFLNVPTMYLKWQ